MELGDAEWAWKMKIVNLLYVCAASALGYDYILTLEREVSLIWLSPWSSTKILFVLTRYSPIIATCLLLHNHFNPEVISRHICNITWATAAWLLIIGINSAEIVIMIRTWAVWGRDRKVGACCASLIAAAMTAQSYYTAKAINSVEFNSPEFEDHTSSVAGCVVISVNYGIFFVNMTASCVIDTVVLVLMVISAIRVSKSNRKSHLATVVHRDSLIFYGYLVCLILVEPIVLARNLDVTRDPGLFLLILVQSISYSILTCRIIFNIRSVGEDEDNTVELYATLTLDFHVDLDDASSFTSARGGLCDDPSSSHSLA